MYLDPKTTLFGVPVLSLRDLLRALPKGNYAAYSFDWDRHYAELAEGRRVAVEQGLLKDGYITKRSDTEVGDRLYSLTNKGLRFANASGRLYQRKAAKRSLEKLLVRLAEINDGDYACWIETLVLFGSFLGDAERVSDLDVAYQLKSRFERGTDVDFVQWNEKFVRRAPSNYGSICAIGWGEVEVQRKLKGRDPIISLTPLGGHEAMLASGPYQVVFGEWTPPLGAEGR